MASFSIEAVVLSRKDIGEADRLLTIFSRTLGKMRVIAKGVRRPTSRMSSHVEPGRESKLLMVERRSLPLITQAETVRNFLPDHQNLEEIQDILQMLEIVNVLLDDGQRESRLYDFLVQLLAKQQSVPNSARRLITGIFAIKTLALLGYRIEVERCVTCREPITFNGVPTATTETAPASTSVASRDIFFDLARGGLTHDHGKRPGLGVFQLDAPVVRLLQQLQQGQLTNLPIISPELTQQLVLPIYAFVEWHADRRLKTASLLD